MSAAATLYVLRRKDTGEYFKNIKPSWLKDWPKDDPRRNHWTRSLSEASLYSLSGVKSLRGNQEHNFTYRHNLEIVRVKVVEDGVETI